MTSERNIIFHLCNCPDKNTDDLSKAIIIQNQECAGLKSVVIMATIRSLCIQCEIRMQIDTIGTTTENTKNFFFKNPKRTLPSCYLQNNISENHPSVSLIMNERPEKTFSRLLVVDSLSKTSKCTHDFRVNIKCWLGMWGWYWPFRSVYCI